MIAILSRQGECNVDSYCGELDLAVSFSVSLVLLWLLCILCDSTEKQFSFHSLLKPILLCGAGQRLKSNNKGLGLGVYIPTPVN